MKLLIFVCDNLQNQCQMVRCNICPDEILRLSTKEMIWLFLEEEQSIGHSGNSQCSGGRGKQTSMSLKLVWSI